MLVVALILIVAIPLVAACFRAVPPDSVGLVERLGRILPVVHKPGVVLVRPFVERLLIFPVTPFPVTCVTDAEVAGVVLKLTVDARCVIHDALKFQHSLPPTPSNDPIERGSVFLSALLNSEGRALLREMSASEGLADPYDFGNRLSDRLEWHTRSVGIKLSGIQVSGFGLPPQTP